MWEFSDRFDHGRADSFNPRRIRKDVGSSTEREIFLYILADLRSRVRRSGRSSALAFRGERLLRSLAFLSVCLAYTFLEVGILRYWFSGTGKVLRGPEAVGPVSRSSAASSWDFSPRITRGTLDARRHNRRRVRFGHDPFYP